MNAIQIKNITKRYKDVTALDDISFSFEFGRIYGFLGRNGAGKSTLINIIANRIFADQGEVLIDGIPAKVGNGAILATMYTIGTPFAGPFAEAAIPSSNFRILWPIPLLETNNNPTLAAQQNPSW